MDIFDSGQILAAGDGWRQWNDSLEGNMGALQSNFLLKARITVLVVPQTFICFSFNAGIGRFHIFCSKKQDTFLDK